MTPLAIGSDVVAILGPLTDAQAAVVDGLLEQASVKVYLAAKRAGVDLTALDELSTLAVKAAVVNAAVRVLRNPEGLRQFQRTMTAGPFTQTEGGSRGDADRAGLFIDVADVPWVTTNGGSVIGTARLAAGMASPSAWSGR